MNRKITLAVALLAGMLAPRVCAQSLFSIPTAETLDARTLTIDVEQDGGPQLHEPPTLRLATVRVGVTDRLTLGFDTKISGAWQVRPNFSFRLTKKDAPLSFAVGYENIGVRSFGEQPYAVASAKLGKARLHLGATRETGGLYRAMLGAERDLPHGLTLQADYINGDGNFFTVGAQKSLSHDFALTLGWMRANTRREPNGIFVDVSREIHF